MGKALRPLKLTTGERRLLESWVRAGTTPQRVVRRARIVLLAADGIGNRTISGRLSISSRTVQLWRARFAEGGPAILERDAPGRGRKPAIAREPLERLFTLLRASREDGRRWTLRLLAEATGFSRASVHRLIRRHAASGRH